MHCNRIQYSDHIISQMFKRNISLDEVRFILGNSEIIKEYPEDKPYPSFLLLGFINLRQMHLLVAKEKETDYCILVTVYEPDKNFWKSDFKIKIK